MTLNGWLRNCLWSERTQVIQSYKRDGISAHTFIFMTSHSVWSFSLMFLYSGRAYWQELIESIIWAHTKIKITPHIQPRALNITQGRRVGSPHFILGGIGCTWSFLICEGSLQRAGSSKDPPLIPNTMSERSHRDLLNGHEE